jgi:hypothetical protein
MRVRVFKLFGREVARLEDYRQATLSDVLASLAVHRREAEGDDEADAEVDRRFEDLTDRIVWDALDWDE